jgi:hypothetical protein
LCAAVRSSFDSCYKEFTLITYFVNTKNKILGLAHNGDTVKIRIGDDDSIEVTSKTKVPDHDHDQKQVDQRLIPMAVKFFLLALMRQEYTDDPARLLTFFLPHIREIFDTM